MFKKYKLLLIINLTLLLGYFLYSFLVDNYNNKQLSPKVTISAKYLTYLYFSNEKTANELYVNKIIKVYGTIKEISYLNDRNTIILAGHSNASGVICDLNKTEFTKLNQLKINQPIYIKGICKGYLKDVILLNSYIDILKNNE